MKLSISLVLILFSLSLLAHAKPTAGTTPGVQCTLANRLVRKCPTDYEPVCGYKSSEVVCVRAPCTEVTYQNACFACKDFDVLSYTPTACEGNNSS